MSSLAESFVKFGNCVRPTAGHCIQLAVRERAMIFERGDPPNVVGLGHDLLHPSQRGPSVAVRPYRRSALAATVTLITGRSQIRHFVMAITHVDARLEPRGAIERFG
jgi:hypothetical protein